MCQTIFTYNQGFVIGTDVLLYRISKDPAYLGHATKIADATLDFYTPDRLWKEAAPFVAIFFRNLLALDHYAPNPRYRRTLQAYLDRVWREARDPETGLFTRGGVGIYDAQHGYGSLDQAAFVQMFALLVWPQDRLPD